MTMRNAIVVLALAAAAAAHAADKPCSPADAAAADKAIDRVVTWQQLYKTWQDYGHCDTGPTADNFTDALMRLTVAWKKVSDLSGQMRSDAKYRDFVMAHVKSDAAKDDRASVFSRAKKDCPGGQDAFCADLVDAINQADEADAAKEKANARPTLAPMAPLTPAAPAKK
jgi:hypothetical protein